MTIAIAPHIEMPLIGLGTSQLKNKSCTDTVSLALEIGYRHFDTAHMYQNHKALGKALQTFPRNELFITSKFTPDQLDTQTVDETCSQALEELNCEYLDLYLLHYPDQSKSLEAILHNMHELVEAKKVRAIGVSNCTQRHIQDMLKTGIPFCINQVEFHPYLYQKDLWDYCSAHGMQIESYSPFGRGTLTADPIFERIGEAYGKTACQIILRWLIQKKIPAIPKASSRKHLEENLDVFNFSLSPRDSDILDHMQTQQRFHATSW